MKLGPKEVDTPTSPLRPMTHLELENDGSNIGPWRKRMETQPLPKRCHKAVPKTYTATIVEAAAAVLLISSLFEHFHNATSPLPTALLEQKHIREDFSGGSNQE